MGPDAMIAITDIRRVNENEMELILSDGIRTQLYSMYYIPAQTTRSSSTDYDTGLIPYLTWDQAFSIQFGKRLGAVKSLMQAILKSFADGVDVDMAITIEGELEDIGDQPGKGANWIWAYQEREKK